MKRMILRATTLAAIAAIAFGAAAPAMADPWMRCDTTDVECQVEATQEWLEDKLP